MSYEISDVKFHKLLDKVKNSPRLKCVSIPADEKIAVHYLMEMATLMCKDFNLDEEVSFMGLYTVFCMICDQFDLSIDFKLSAFDIYEEEGV